MICSIIILCVVLLVYLCHLEMYVRDFFGHFLELVYKLFLLQRLFICSLEFSA